MAKIATGARGVKGFLGICFMETMEWGLSGVERGRPGQPRAAPSLASKAKLLVVSQFARGGRAASDRGPRHAVFAWRGGSVSERVQRHGTRSLTFAALSRQAARRGSWLPGRVFGILSTCLRCAPPERWPRG